MSAKPKSAAYRLWFYRYHVRVPQMYLYSNHYMQKHGYGVSGDAALDQARLMEMTTVYQSPAGIAILFDEGAPIDFVRADDAVATYNDIREHLLNWERAIAEGIHPELVPPLEDFRKLEAVAQELYTSAKYYDANETSGQNIREALISMNRVRNPVRTEKYLRSKLQTEEGQLKPFVSIVDRIERDLLEELD